MGITLSLSGVIGKSKPEVVAVLREYLNTKSGGIEPELNDIRELNNNGSILTEGTNGITVYYPYGFDDWDEASMRISEGLKCPVFTFHIHHGEFWMYVLYNNGEFIDEFNPIPDYWNPDISEKELEKLSGNPELISQIIESVDLKNISNYFYRWDVEGEPVKAYPEDEFENNGLQLVDFMKKIGLEYPLDDSGYPKGDIYAIWTRNLTRVKNQKSNQTGENNLIKNPWWKFW